MSKDGQEKTETKNKSNGGNRRFTLKHPEQHFKPEDLLHFIELKPFTRRWGNLGLDDESDLAALQMMIMADPKGPPVVKGTAGLRKLRFAPDRWNCGKSGAARVSYVHFEDFGIVLLVLVYGKGEVGTISDAVKKHLNTLIREQERELERRKRI